MSISKQRTQEIYQSRAKHYDLSVKLYQLIGLSIKTYRLHAVKLLRLKPGDCVVEMGCGTGLNFPLIIERIGPEGRLIGVDLTPEMLGYAQERIERFGWKNVELIQSDIINYDILEGVNAVLSTGVFGYVEGFDRVIEAASHALAPNGRLVIMDVKNPERWQNWVVKLLVLLGRPYGLTLDYFKSHPWESVERYLQDTTYEEMYGGAIYFSSGTAPSLKG